MSNAVAVVLTTAEPPKLFALLEVPKFDLTLDGFRFEDAGLGDWLGFYDWLRAESGEIVGVRLWLDELNAHLPRLKACRNVVISGANRELVIYFGVVRTFEATASDDQDFGANRLFVCDGRFAISFNTPAGAVT